jgi:hypothetical protein
MSRTASPRVRPQRPHEPNGKSDAAAGERVDLVAYLRADHGDPGERGLDDVVAQRRVSIEDEAEKRDEREQ